MRNLQNVVTSFLSRVRQSSLARDSFWMLLAQGISFACLMLYFLIVARVLGTDGYGAFVGVASLAAIVSPFAGWGSEHLLVRNVSRDRESLAVSWGNCLLLIIVSGSLITIVMVPLISAFLVQKVPAVVSLLIFVADLIGLRMQGVAGSVFVALNLIKWSAIVRVGVAVVKLASAAIFLLFLSNTGIWGWSIVYCLGTLLPTLFLLFFISHKFAKPEVSLKVLVSDLREGFYFAINASSETINASLDKAMLASLGTLNAAGLYGAGYRFIDFGFFPLFALQAAAYPNFFKYGASGIQGSWSFAKRLLPVALAYGGASAFVLLFIAPSIIPLALGSEYRDAASVLRWLFPIHGLAFLQYLFADTLTGAGFQGFKSGIQVLAAFTNFGLNYWLIPLISWRGAALATLSVEVLKTIALCSLVFVFIRRQQKMKKASRQEAQ